MSRVEESRRENCSGVRIGLRVFVAGSWEGKMEMWRGLFCIVFLGQSSVLRSPFLSCNRYKDNVHYALSRQCRLSRVLRSPWSHWLAVLFDGIGVWLKMK